MSLRGAIATWQSQKHRLLQDFVVRNDIRGNFAFKLHTQSSLIQWLDTFQQFNQDLTNHAICIF